MCIYFYSRFYSEEKSSLMQIKLMLHYNCDQLNQLAIIPDQFNDQQLEIVSQCGIISLDQFVELK